MSTTKKQIGGIKDLLDHFFNFFVYVMQVNPSRKIVLEASVKVVDGSGFNATWSLLSGTLARGYDLINTALTPISQVS